MLAGLSGIHLLVIVLIVVVLFGATKLPIFAKSLGQTVRILRAEVRPDAAPVSVVPEDAPTTVR